MRFPVLVMLAGSILGACYAGEEAGSAPLVDRTTPGPLMRAGDNCLACHGEGRSGSSVKWSFGGTVYPARKSGLDEGVGGATIVLKDANGKEVRVTANSVGNFWSEVPLKAPFDVQIEQGGKVRKMPIPAPAGSCNACHAASPLGGAEGAIIPP